MTHPSPSPSARPLSLRPPNCWYSDSVPPGPARPPLRGEIAADVCVVGAGMTGCSAALHLAERGYRVVVLESRAVGFGASGRNGGQLIAGFAGDMDVAERHFEAADCRRLFDFTVEAVDLVRDLARRHDIACDLVPGMVSAALKQRHVDDLHAMAEQWQGYGYDRLEWLDASAVRGHVACEAYVGGLWDRGGGHLHPLAYTLGLAAAAERAGAVIYEDTAFTDHEETALGVVVRTGAGAVVRAAWVLFAGNAYSWGRIRGAAKTLDQRIMPAGTYVIATEPLGEARATALLPHNDAVSDVQFVLNYYRRSADHRLLFGGGVSYSRIDPPRLAGQLRRTMVGFFPQLADVAVTHAWGGFVAITANRLPHFGRIGRRALFAQGYSGHGVALTSLAGKMMAEVVGGTEDRFDLMAAIPHMPFPGGHWLRTPLLMAAMAWMRLKDRL